MESLCVWKMLNSEEVEIWRLTSLASGTLFLHGVDTQWSRLSSANRSGNPLQVMVKDEDVCLMAPSAAEQIPASDEGWEKVVSPSPFETPMSASAHAAGLLLI